MRAFSTAITGGLLVLGAMLTGPVQGQDPKPPAETKPAEPEKKPDTPKPAEPEKKADTPAPAPTEPEKKADTPKPTEPEKKADAPKPAEPAKPADAPKPAEPAKPAEPEKKADTPKPAEPEKKADAPTPPAADPRIAEVEKQIAELNKKLATLKEEAAAKAKAAKDAPPTATIPAEWVKALQWRPIGPANMGGRITALAIDDTDPSRWWAATASGGLLKTINDGTAFEHQFDREATVSVGDVAVAPSDPNIIYVGTGEANPRNSVSYGDGVYKSTDGGKTWTNVGLKGSFQIGKVIVHPKDPNTVYVGALGRLYGPSEERGLFKTTDGGKTWNKILYVDDKTGVVDMRMSPADPETLLVAMYERKRDEFDGNEPAVRWGKGSGIHKTTDGGKTFKRLTQGLPTGMLGRIGLEYYKKDPKVVFAIVESEKTGMGPPGARPGGASTVFLGISGEDLEGGEGGALLNVVTAGGPADKAGLKPGDRITAAGGKPVKTYEGLIESLRERKPGEKLKVSYVREGMPQETEVELASRPVPPPRRGGDPNRESEAGPPRPFASMLNGQVENAQDKQNPDGHEYGGLFKSTDGGETWTRINSINPRPMYFSQVRVDPSDDKYVYVLGIAFHSSTDGGKTFKGGRSTGVHDDGHALWIDPRDGRHMILGTDGGLYVTRDRGATWDHLNHVAIGQFYHVALDTRRNYRVYGGLQDNGTWGGPAFTRSRVGPVNEDWVNVMGGDGFGARVDPNDPDQVYFTAQNGATGRRNFRTGETATIRPRAPQGKPLRFNWNTPFYLSNHNSKIYYVGGNFLFRSIDRGRDLQAISPELTRTDKGSASCVAESPRTPNVVWVGTDDGNLWLTRDGGKEWTEVSKNVGLPGPRWVASVEPSRYEDGRCYVAFDGHRSNDDDPHVYVTDDYGKTWKSLKSNLPWGSTRCLREDIKNKNLLFCGTEFGLWFSIDRGLSWTKINNTLPTVAVLDVALHPTAGELVAATHGRSLWVLDVAPLRALSAETLKAPATLLAPNPYVRWRTEPTRGTTNRRFSGTNPAQTASIYVALTAPAKKTRLRVFDYDGKSIRDLRVPTTAGLHRIPWDTLRLDNSGGGFGGLFGGFGGGGGGGGGARPVSPGTYRLVLTVNDKESSQPLRIEPDPTVPAEILAAEEAFLDADDRLEVLDEEEVERREEAEEHDRDKEADGGID